MQPDPCPSCQRPVARVTAGAVILCAGVTTSRAYHHADGSVCIPRGTWLPWGELAVADQLVVLRGAAEVAVRLGEEAVAEVLTEVADSVAASNGLEVGDAA